MPFCTLFAGLGSTNKSAISLLLLSDSRSVLTTLSSPPSFLLSQTLWQIWQELSSLSSCSIRLQWVPRHLFLQGTTRLMSWPDGECYLHPLQSLVVSLLLSLASTHAFSWTGGVLSHLNSLTLRFPQFDTQELVLPCHARCVLSRLHCNKHSLLLGSYLSRIVTESIICPAAPVDNGPRTPLISFCTVQRQTLNAAYSLATLGLSTTSGPGSGE